MRQFYYIVIVGVLGVGALLYGFTQAASLTVVRDLISTSAQSTSANHTIEFTVTNAVPASGSFVITPEASAFTIPAGFDVTDIDVATAATSGAPYVERTLGATANTSQDGVAVVTGTSGSITVTLNSSAGIAAGERVRVKLGTHASFGVTGDQALLNPADTGSYRVTITTRDASNGVIDSAIAMIAVVAPVTVSGIPELVPPGRFNGLPSGSIPAGNPSIEISLNTDEPATCRFATTTNVLYEDMTNTFTSANANTTHYKVIGGHQDATSYSYYVRCIDFSGLANDDDYAISFSIEDPEDYDTSGGSEEGTGSAGEFVNNFTTGPGGNSGSSSGGLGGFGEVPGGSQVLYLSSVTFSGKTGPLNRVVILKDGTQALSMQSDIDGAFSNKLSGLERGIYTFVVYSEDAFGNLSAGFSSTLTFEQDTHNTLSNITLPPSIGVASEQIEVGQDMRISGQTLPGHEVEVFVRPQTESASLGDTKRYTATSVLSGASSKPAGSWEVVVEGSDLRRGTYDIRARTIIATSTQTKTGYSKRIFIGVGEEASVDASVRADINGDGKVNLVDFSIMLSFWGTADTSADINEDGTVNLADFSILLFNWTG